MLAVILVLIIVAVIQLICVLALIDQYKGLLQIRRTIGLIEPLRLVSMVVCRARCGSWSTVRSPRARNGYERSVFWRNRCWRMAPAS